MKLRKITEKPKKKRGLMWFLIILLILGFIAAVKLGNINLMDMFK